MNHQIRKAVHAAILAGAAIGGLAAGGIAMAADITQVAAGDTLYAGGSTAVSASLTAYFLQSTDSTSEPCDETKPIDYYTDATGSTQFFAVACTANGNTGLTAGTPIAVVKELNGGSFNGLGPVGGDTALTFPVTSTLTSPTYETALTSWACADTTVAAEVVGGATLAVSYTKHTCSSAPNNPTDTAAYATQGAAPNIGFADVDPGAFGTTATALGVTTGQTVDLIFAPAVSLGLYHALQQAEGLGQDDALADIPNLTKDQLTSLFTGQVASWSTLTNSAGATLTSETVTFGTNNSIGQYGGATGATTSSATVYFCRRDLYSGTERTDEIYYAGQNCMTGIDTFRNGTNQTFGNSWSTSADSAVATFAGSSTGNVLSCLEGHDSVGHFAIGYASVDNPWGLQGTPAQSASKADFRYIKVNGVVPSVENAAAGVYQVFAQSVYALPLNGAGNYPAGDALVIANYVTGGTAAFSATAFGKAATVAAVNALDTWSNPSFDGGLLAIPKSGLNTPNASSAALSTFAGNPVNDYVHATGTTLNNCQNPVKFSTVTSLGTGDATNWAGP